MQTRHLRSSSEAPKRQKIFDDLQAKVFINNINNINKTVISYLKLGTSYLTNFLWLSRVHQLDKEQTDMTQITNYTVY